jgi:hypothetical protein
MICYEVVQKVLDDAYSKIELPEAEKDAEITSTIKAISRQYNNRLLASGGPDFDSPISRFAYVFSYVPVHAFWIYELINDNEEVGNLFRNKRLRIVCLGGGPGSDLIGVLKYLDKKGISPQIQCDIIDGCVAWKETWGDIAYQIEWPGNINTTYYIQNAGDPETWRRDPCKTCDADIMTVNFFISEIHHLGDVALRYIYETLCSLKPGAIVLINDNAIDAVNEVIGNLPCDFEVIDSGNEFRRTWDANEDQEYVQKYKEKFNRAPKLTGKVKHWILKRK